MSPTYDLTGKRYGRLVVLSYGKNKLGLGAWLCKCDCGNNLYVLGGNLRKGVTRSCGCLKHDVTVERNTKHGAAGTKFYDVWCAIKARCCNPRNKRYPEYGGRGIKIHPAWEHDFAAFRDYILSNLGERPSDKHSLDRIDNDRGYEPGNLRWATVLEQNHNSRNFYNPAYRKTLFKKSEERWNECQEQPNP